MDFYVYYKVRDADTAHLQAAVIAMQAALAVAYGVSPQLKRRPPEDGDMQTWMEVYPGVGQARFAEALEATAAQAGLARWISGPRHVELFEDLPPCA